MGATWICTTLPPSILPFSPELSCPAGSAGAALSHQSVYRKIIADGVDKALVLEDDVTLPADLGSLADAVADQLTGAEVALLSVDSPDPCKMSLEGSIQLPSGRLLALPIDINQPRSAGAYIITREACERMIKCVVPIQVQADTWWFFYREGVLDRVRCVTPLPVLKSPKFTSTIGSYSLGDGVRGPPGRAICAPQDPDPASSTQLPAAAHSPSMASVGTRRHAIHREAIQVGIG